MAAVVETEIKKSPADDRTYRYLELSNKLKVLVIHDDTTDKAAAALNVNIGASHDPEAFPGLAHFCEHMLFLGTEKYPAENAYSKYLSEHAGSSNAYTMAADTMYYFDVGWEHLDGAVDRFAQFFHKPLFNQDCTDREVNAVNSENEKNLNHDGWRLRQLDKHCSDPKHTYAKFSTGNKRTLKEQPEELGLDTRSALLEFHSTYYSANIMGLTILGRESLDELVAMAESKFATIENKDVVTPVSDTHPHAGEFTRKTIKAVPVREIRSIEMNFPMEDQTFNYTSQPGHYLSHLLGHEGKGSLLSYLKAKGWALGLYAGGQSGEVGTYGFFKITVELSEQGLKHTDDIVEATFRYIAMLRATPIQEWVFEECRKLLDIDFRFKEKSQPAGYVQSVAKKLRIYPAKTILSAIYDMIEFKPELIESILACLVPTALRLFITSKSFEGDDGLRSEPHYGTQYLLEDLDPTQLARWAAAAPIAELHYPPPNDFIAANFDLQAPPADVADSAMATVPHLLQDTPRCKLWHKQDTTFLLPKGQIAFVLTSPIAYTDPERSAMTRLFADMFKDALNEFAYDAELSGIQYGVNSTQYGIDISVSGYHNKLPDFLYTVVERLVTLRVDAERFPLIKDTYQRSLKSFNSSEPVSLSSFMLTRLLSEKVFAHDEILAALEGIDCAKVQAFIPVLLNRLHLEGFVYGNFTEQNARQIAARVSGIFGALSPGAPLLTSEREHFRLHKLEAKPHIYRELTTVHKICCVKMYYQVGPDNQRSNALLNLFVQLTYEHFFDVLRTNEQLGYNVYAQAHRSCGVRGFQMSVQSNRDPEHVESRMRAWITAVPNYIEALTDEQYANHVQALSTKLLEKPKRMVTEYTKYWSEIINGFYVFDRALLANEVVVSATKAEVLEFVNKHFKLGSPHCCELVVHVFPAEGETPAAARQDAPATAEPIVSDAIVIEDVTRFKQGLGLHPLSLAKQHDVFPEVVHKAGL